MHRLRVKIAVAQLVQGSTQPTHGAVQAQNIACTLVYSEENKPEALVLVILRGQLDVEFSLSGKTTERTSRQRIGQVKARLASYAIGIDGCAAGL
jgi:hypothetical protein